MNHHKSWAVALLGLALLAAAAARAAQPWSCQVEGFRVEWSDDNIIAGAEGRQRGGFSAREFAAADYAAVRKEIADMRPSSVVLWHRFSVVSLAGPLLGLRDEAEVDVTPSAHPGGETRLRTVDLRSSRPMTLTGLFQPSDIRSGLLADSFLKPALDDAPKTLDAIVRDLADNVDRLRDACVSVPADLLTRFAIVGADRGGVLVRIGLPGSGPCRNNLTQVGLRLPSRGAIASILPRGARDICVPPPGMTPLTVTLGG
jgi:hypothetical protein